MPTAHWRRAASLCVGRLSVGLFAFCILAVPALVVATHHHEDGEEHLDCQLCEFATAPAAPATIVLPPQPEADCLEGTPEAVRVAPRLVVGHSPDAPRAPPVLLTC